MNTTKTKKPKPNEVRRLKLSAGVVLLAKPEKPQNDFKCVRCAWEWPARKKEGLPARCPHCSSPSWNKNRVRAGEAETDCHCQHCGWDWQASKDNGIPAQCPKCKKYDWNGKPALPSAKPAGVE